MKILYIVDGLDRGGVESIVTQLSNNFSYLGHEVHIISLYEDKRDIVDDIISSVKIHYLPLNSKQNHICGYLFNFRRLIVLLKKISPDVVHTHNSSFSFLFFSSAIFLSRIKYRAVRSMHFCGFFLERKSKRDKIRYFIDKLGTLIIDPIIVSVGPTVYSTILPLYAHSKHICITNGIDTKVRFNKKDIKKSSYNIDDNRLVVTYVARICEGKNHHTLVNAFEKVIKLRDALLILVGDGPLMNEIQTLVREKNLNQYVRFTGAIANVEDILSISDIGVFPSESEGLGLALLEMMSIGLPVIVSNIPTFVKMIDHGVTGFFYDTYDAEMLSRQLTVLLDDQQLRSTVGHNARQFVHNNFSIDNMIKQYLKLYEAF